MPRSALLLVNREKPEVVSALAAVRSLIERHGRIVAELPADNSPLPINLARGADMVVALGGDGTLMAQSRRCAALGLPMLGVNFGKLGFMSEFDLDSLRDQAAALFGDSPLNLIDRPLLHCMVSPSNTRPFEVTTPGGAANTVESNGAHPHHALALNDAVITAGPPYRMISLTIGIDGQPGPRVTGDGLVVCTPIGSTAYNASLGGPIVSPAVDAMTLSPVAPQSLSFRPVVVPLSSTIELTLERVNDDPSVDGVSGGTCLVLDGQVATRLHVGQRITIKRHAKPIRFVQNPRGSYWSTLIHKMRWAAPPATR